MNLFMPPRKVTRAPPQPAAALRVQSSAQGTARAIVWGLARLAGNLIGFLNFAANAVTETVQGGKGGGGTSVTTGFVYTGAVAIGLSEGPVAAIRQYWSNKTPENLITEGWELYLGGYEQAPAPWLSQNQPQAAQSFRGLAYAFNPHLSLGSDPSLPNLTFEVRGAVAGLVVETATIPGSPYQVTPAYFDITSSSAAEEVTVPFASPFEIIAQNPQAYPFGLSGVLNEAPSPGDSNTGVYYTDTDPPAFLTKVASSPGTGSYTVSGGSSYVYTFAAGDAGANVTIVDAAVSPGVNFAVAVSGDLTSGSDIVANLSATQGIAIGDPVRGPGVPAGAVVQALSGGAATGAVSSGSAIVGVSGGSYVVSAGSALASDSAALFPGGTTVTGTGGAIATLSIAPVGSATEAVSAWRTKTGTWSESSGGIALADVTGLIAGMVITDDASIIDQMGYTGAMIGTITGSGPYVVTLAGGGYATSGISIGDWGVDDFTFTATVTGTLTSGVAQATNLPDAGAFAAGAHVTDALGYLPRDGSSTVTSSAGTSLVLSHTATGSSGSDVLTFPSELVLSQNATSSAIGADLTITGSALQQVVASPSTGEFSLTPAGVYTFAAADTGKTVAILDQPDANPADIVADFLTNPYYGVPLFPAARLGDLSVYRSYCQALGLGCSPVLASQQQATQLLQDLMTATNSEMVWSGGLLSVVPYGDAALSGNGASYAPPTQPLYDLDDDDFLPNEGTNASSVAAVSSPDPVTVTRLDPADQVNDIQVEYLDRAQDYNPVIAEVQDDAAINLYGLKSSGSKQLHLLCDRRAALQSANLQLSRQLVRNLYCFTLGREYILLDPMDIVAISDKGLGLVKQWVRIREITENQDRSLSIVAEEYLAGTGAAPRFGHQAGSGYRPAFNADPGDALPPVLVPAPPQLIDSFGIEAWLATGGGPLWGGCEVWRSSDGIGYFYAGTMSGATTMGTLTASLGQTGAAVANTTAGNATFTIGQAFTGGAGDAIAGVPLAAGATVASVSADGLTITLSSGSDVLITASSIVNLVNWTADRVNTLSVDLSESEGTLLPASSQADADAGDTACYLYNPTAGLSGGSLAEFVSFEQATLTSQYKYNLGKNGSTSGYLHRNLFTGGGGGYTFPAGSQFVRLRKGSLFQMPLGKDRIGDTVHVKLLSFNIWGGGRQTLDQATAYSFTVGGSAPKLSDFAAAALYGDLASGAASNVMSATGTTGGVTNAWTTILAPIITTVGGAVMISAQCTIGPGAGSPAATTIQFRVRRATASGSFTTIWTGDAINLPASGNAPGLNLPSLLDAPEAGQQTYSVDAIANQGTAPYGAVTFSAAELRR